VISIEERRTRSRQRRAAIRALYIRVFGSTRLLRGPEKRRCNAKRRREAKHRDG
jgi:hypothetical protein